MRRKHGKGRGKKKEKKKLREPVIGPLTELDARMLMFEGNITVEHKKIRRADWPAIQDYLADLAIQLWLARPSADRSTEVPK
jgi:hypothetical protein